MENEIYVANRVADTYKKLPQEEQDRVTSLIDSLNGDGWKNSEIVAPNGSEWGGLRSKLSGNLRLLFSYAPELHAIIVTGITALEERELVA